MPLSRASTRRRYNSILGITSWYQSLLRPRSPTDWSNRWRSSLGTHWKLFESYIISESRISLLLIPFLSGEDSWRLLLSLLFSKLHQFFLGIPRVFWDCFDVLVTRILFSMPPVTEELSFGVSLTQAYRGSTKYLRRPTSKISPIRPVAR